MKKVGSRPLRYRERKEPVGYGGKNVFDQILSPQKNPFLMTRRAEQPGLVGKRHNLLVATGPTGIDGHALPRVPTHNKPPDSVINGGAEGTEEPLEAGGIGPNELTVVIVHNPKKRALIKNPSPVFDRDRTGADESHRSRKTKSPAEFPGASRVRNSAELSLARPARRTPNVRNPVPPEDRKAVLHLFFCQIAVRCIFKTAFLSPG